MEYIILGMLLEEPLTGYDLKKYIEEGVGTFYKASYGSLYPLLKRLTESGSLTQKEQPQGGRQKKYYQITEKGRIDFFEWLKAPISLNDGTDNKLVKVYFFDKLPKEVRDVQLQEFELSNLNYLQKLRNLEEKFSRMENQDCFYYKLSTLYYGMAMVQETIRWCRHIRAQKNLPDLLMKGVNENDSKN